MDLKIALAGNPNSGKTTLFNALTGSNQFVGNWPGVTVEKKEGKLKNHDGVTVTDLPGIYSLSPYTLEEVVARKYLIDERPDVILNIVDGTNLERNLYLTTQLIEIGIPVVIAINMMDIVRKNGDKINTEELSRRIGCKTVEISALKGDSIMEAAEAAIEAANNAKTVPQHIFSGVVEHAIAHIEEAVLHDAPLERQRWYAVKIFERDIKVIDGLGIPHNTMRHIENDIKAAEAELDDDSESIITNERYVYVENVLSSCYKKKNAGRSTTSDKIDKIVTSRWLGLPVFALIMFLVYYISMVSIGSTASNWANNGLFGDGYFLFGNGRAEYNKATEEYSNAMDAVDAFLSVGKNGEEVAEAIDSEADGFEAQAAAEALDKFVSQFKVGDEAVGIVTDEETLASKEVTYSYGDLVTGAEKIKYYEFSEPVPSDYGTWISGIPVIVEGGLNSFDCPEWLRGLILNGIVAGVGAVLGFAPQMFVLFLFLAFLEACGYMARIAFVLDRLFRKFGLSGKSFIPMLIGSGCGVPGIMASRTIENERDRRMTIITTTFIPCGAKVPFISMIAGAIFNNSAWIATSAYFLGMASIIVSGVILKKTRRFAGEPSPFVMELPAYHWPMPRNVLRSMWDRGWSFVKKAGTVILLSSIVVWFLSDFGFTESGFRMLVKDELGMSILATIGNAIAWIFTPLGWGDWQAAVASITGLFAKENIVATLGVLYSGGGGNVYTRIAEVFTPVSAYSLLAFNLLCAPCVAAMGAIRREMNNAGWTWFAIGYQCGFAYLVSLVINQIGNIFIGRANLFGVAVAVVILIFAVYMLFKPYKEVSKLTAK